MWKTQLNKSVQELRFVLKQSPDHNGVWYVVIHFVIFMY